MELPINTDPQDLNKNMLGGRKWWQYLCIAISFIIAIVFTIVFRGKLDSSVNGIVCSLLVVVPGYIGIFKKNDLDFFEYYRHKKLNTEGQNVFFYVSEPPRINVVHDSSENKKNTKRKGR